jgi:hypothetical protein
MARWQTVNYQGRTWQIRSNIISSSNGAVCLAGLAEEIILNMEQTVLPKAGAAEEANPAKLTDATTKASAKWIIVAAAADR